MEGYKVYMMSDNDKNPWSAKPFVLLDTGDNDGVRAEVKVQKGLGTVKEIRPNGRSANVTVTVEGLKHPVGGWINTDEDAYKILEEAKENGRLVYFRVESQRKRTVDRTTPISELTASVDLARENTIRLFVGAGFTEPVTLTGEAVTDPDEDPNASGRPQGIVAAKKSAPTPGPRPEATNNFNAAPRDGIFAREEASYKTYNSDGRFNLGSAAFAAAVSAEQFAREQFTKGADLPEERNERGILFLARNILRMADNVQASVYGEGYRVDRSGASHTRARGILYDTIRDYFPINFEEANKDQSGYFNAWMDEVEKFALKRMSIAFALATEGDETVTPSGNANTSDPAPQGSNLPASDGVNKNDETPSYPDFVHIVNDDAREGAAADEDTVNHFKELVQEAEIDKDHMGALGTLLEISTGHRKVAEISGSALGELMDFYTSNGQLKQAVTWVQENIQHRGA